MNIPNESTPVSPVPNKPFLPFILSSVGLMLILGLSVAANPSPKAYAEYVVWKLKQTTCQRKHLPPLAQVSCASLSMFPHQFSEQILQGYIHREDHALFSIYSIDTLGLSDRSLGIAGRFFDAKSIGDRSDKSVLLNFLNARSLSAQRFADSTPLRNRSSQHLIQ